MGSQHQQTLSYYLRKDQGPPLCIMLSKVSLLDEGSMMTIKIVTNLLTGEGQFRHPFHYCLDS